MATGFGSSFGGGLGGALGGAIGSLLPSSQTTTSSGQSTGTQTQQLKLSPEGYNQVIKDILSSDAGLASLATGENLSGGYGSSVKAQLAQDLVLNIAGEMAKLTAPTVSTTEQKQTSKSKTKKGTVICTELERQGLLDTALYEAGIPHFLSLPEETVAGYRVWANHVVPLMQKYPALARALAPVAQSRYEMIVTGKFGIAGAITIYIGQPLCFLIGSFLGSEKRGNLSATS